MSINSARVVNILKEEVEKTYNGIIADGIEGESFLEWTGRPN